MSNYLVQILGFPANFDISYVARTKTHFNTDYESYSTRLKKMNQEDAFGFVVRSRHQELAEQEKSSLYHVNRELKKGNRSILDSIAEIKNNERIIITDRRKIEQMTVTFFSHLFQGHHRSNGPMENTPFSPDFSNIDRFLS